MFDDKFLDSLPNNGYEAAQAVCDEFFNKISASQDQEVHTRYEKYLEAFGVGQALVEAYGIPIIIPDLIGERQKNVEKIHNFFNGLRRMVETALTKATLEKAKNKFALQLGKTFHYEFSEGDLQKVQRLLNEIRGLIQDSKVVENDHRSRLLHRLEKLQSELHKKVSDLDRFWGLIGDAGVALGKLGNDAKPILDRIREITMLVWATQSRAEGLPSNCPPPLSLPSPPSENSPNPGGTGPLGIDV